MNKKLTTAALSLLLALPAVAQQSNVNLSYNPQKDTEGLIPFSANLNSPQVNDDHTVIFRLRAPKAESVALSGAMTTILGSRGNIPFTKGEDGIWTLTIGPLPVDMYQYNLVVDGVSMADPNNTYAAFTAMPPYSELIVHGDGPSWWDAKEGVPHGSITRHIYYSPVTEGEREIYVYTPPQYDINKKYPVLYLQHGNAENEYGWSVQGHAGQIMDNLLAQKKAVPFIIVMDYGQGQNIHLVGKFAPKEQDNRNNDAFAVVLMNDIIPFIEKEYRLNTYAQHRAMAGLSMGGGQTRRITLATPTKFGYIGMFSGGTISPEDVQAAKGFQDTAKLVFMSCGSKENPKVMEAAEALNKMGVKAAGYVSEGTAHEWHTWRRSLYQFAQQIFK